MADERRQAVSVLATESLWTVKDVAAFVGLSVRWVHERTRRGEIPCYRLGTALRFDPQEIRAWVGKFHHSSGGT
jgi:excisionase family DNA binding protein